MLLSDAAQQYEEHNVATLDPAAPKLLVLGGESPEAIIVASRAALERLGHKETEAEAEFGALLLATVAAEKAAAAPRFALCLVCSAATLKKELQTKAKDNSALYASVKNTGHHIIDSVNGNIDKWGWAKNDEDFLEMKKGVEALSSKTLTNKVLSVAVTVEFSKLAAAVGKGERLPSPLSFSLIFPPILHPEDYQLGLSYLVDLGADLAKLQKLQMMLQRVHELRTEGGDTAEVGPKKKKAKLA